MKHCGAYGTCGTCGTYVIMSYVHHHLCPAGPGAYLLLGSPFGTSKQAQATENDSPTGLMALMHSPKHRNPVFFSLPLFVEGRISWSPLCNQQEGDKQVSVGKLICKKKAAHNGPSSTKL